MFESTAPAPASWGRDASPEPVSWSRDRAVVVFGFCFMKLEISVLQLLALSCILQVLEHTEPGGDGSGEREGTRGRQIFLPGEGPLLFAVDPCSA